MSTRKDNFVSHSAPKLAAERERLGLTQQQAGDRCGVSREMWGKYERGDAAPGAEVLFQFARAGADIQYVVTGRKGSEASPIDEAALRGVIGAIEEYLTQHHRVLSADRKAKLIATLYTYVMAHGINAKGMENIIRLAA